MKVFYALLAFAGMHCLAGNTASAQQAPSWSVDIAPIIYNKCGSCHRPGGIAPFSLLSYPDAAAQSAAVKHATGTGHMPPWPPDPSYRRLAHERLLSNQEKATIAAWVDANVPMGNPALAPPVPVFPANGDLPGTASLTLQIPTYTVPSITTDIYRCFVLPTGLTSDKFITALEAIPGNRSIVHHVLVYADTTGICAQLDAADPGPGYTSFGGVGTSDAIMVGGWVPGTAPGQYPAGFGVKLPQNAKIVVQVHYPAGSTGQQDSTKIRFFFSPTNTVRDVFIIPVLNHSQNIAPALFIPANTVRTFKEQQMNPFNLSLIGIAPHMHLLGTSIKAYGILPTADTQKYINIPEWHFHWQGFYNLRQILRIPSGTMLMADAKYDNTTANPSNPVSPPQPVQAGEGTTDEMMIVYFVVAFYQPGDENIMIDTEAPVGTPGELLYKGSMLLQPYPVPAGRTLYVKAHFDEGTYASIQLVGLDGRTVKSAGEKISMKQGYNVLPLDVSGIASGTYRLVMRTGGQTATQPVVIAN